MKQRTVTLLTLMFFSGVFANARHISPGSPGRFAEQPFSGPPLRPEGYSLSKNHGNAIHHPAFPAVGEGASRTSSLADSVIEAWVAHYAGHGAHSVDQLSAMAIDPGDGSIYVTGSSSASCTGTDYLTVKYNPNGDTMWTARFNGPGAGDNAAAALALDPAGNVYVTGYSYGSGKTFDYATVKYNAAGTRLWVAFYDGPQHGDDIATALTVDRSGNAYVTGKSGHFPSFDYVTIKYDQAGSEQWVARYHGPGDSTDQATAIAIDTSGNVYVTGYGYGSGTREDYLTLKYGPSGAEQWAARYNGPGDSTDEAAAVGVDAAGNVYVTGASTGLGTMEDYATVKYNPSGAEEWVARYNGAGNYTDKATALAIDDSGNVCVTGYSYESTYDFATLKYTASGIQRWVALYDTYTYAGSGYQNGYEYATAIALDDSGNLCVTGYTYVASYSYNYATVKYTASGVKEWDAIYLQPDFSQGVPKAVAVDASGNICVAGSRDPYSGRSYNPDFLTLKYNRGGVQQWFAGYDGPGNSDDQPAAIASDTAGNIYVTGQSGSYPAYDYATVKYSPGGVEEWVARYGDSASSYNVATAIAVDAAGNVYVTGQSSDDYATVKYSSSGVREWVARYSDSANYNQANAIAVDDSGNVYVTGESSGDYATVKYSASGMQQWVARYHAGGYYGSASRATALGLDRSGNVYVTGNSFVFGDAGAFLTAKYDRSGVVQWTTRYNGGDLNDVPTALGVDASGNVVVTGWNQAQGYGNYEHYVTAKYDSSGTLVWVARDDQGGASYDHASGLALDESGNVYVTGYGLKAGYPSYKDYVTIKLGETGQVVWVARYDGPANGDDEAVAVAVDATGCVYVAGSSEGVGTSLDYAVVKYNPQGSVQWVARHAGAENAYERATAFHIDRSGTVSVTGTYSASGGACYETVQFSQPLYRRQFSLHVNDNWNIVSIPRNLGDRRARELFSTAISPAFEYRGGYVRTETLSIGNAYWMKFDRQQQFSLIGDSIAVDTIDATVRWNLIGSISLSVSSSSITSDPPGLVTSPFFAYNGSGYRIADTIRPGEGYWVRLDQGGKLILSSATAVPAAARIRIVSTDDLPPGAPDAAGVGHPASIPREYALEQNYPNPFNPSTVIRYSLPLAGPVTLKVYDLLGREVNTLVDENQDAGYKSVSWDARALPSGVYFYRLLAGSHTETRKLMILK
jgi:uncharacterized delta-60 repeat protein